MLMSFCADYIYINLKGQAVVDSCTKFICNDKQIQQPVYA